MRRLAAVLLVFTLAACGSGDTPVSEPESQAMPPPTPVPHEGRSLACGSTDVKLPAMSKGLIRAGSFARLGSLTRQLEVKGLIWRKNDEELYVGVVCGVRSVEQFVTLVARSTLTAYKGRPALRWTTRTGLRNFMWLERPGTAVYLAATPGLAAQIKQIAAGVTLKPAP
ncbi:hypothetical protein [Nonomuraea sp. NPDC049784]|uniref:hypothetical protein n=1 Tax=Nonomuraea sp. NPDC049784 TaxID=3154361 RepID=UPI0033CE5D15